MRALPWLALVAFAGCQQLSLTSGRFSCATTTDCGDGFECRPQFAGGGRCFKLGECIDSEKCDGVDENCDGRVDETFPEQGQVCATGKLGICASGKRVCELGALACSQDRMPAVETCNRADDDCDGMTDETFDLTSDEQNCGACGQVCSLGTTCLASKCDETTCDNGLDDDLDGLTDCFDEGCLGLECTSVIPPPWKCGHVLLPDAGADGGTDAGFTFDAGADAGSLDGGAEVFGCFPPESDCANGFDDDGDGMTDCMDLDCDGRRCFSGTSCTNLICPGPG